MEEKVPSELSLAEIRNYMVQHGCKVTNHALVKYFKPFLTDPRTQNEARKQFKTFVNILATIKTENNQKYLVLRKKYLNECPTEENVPDDDKGGTSPEIPMSPGASSISSDFYNSPGNRQPPPYKPPPQVAAGAKLPVLEKETSHNYRDCVNEFQAAMNRLEMNRCRQGVALEDDQLPPALSSPSTDLTQICRTSIENDNSSRNEDNKENVAITLTNTNAQKRNTQEDQSDKRNCEKIDSPDNDERENSFSVKETARKFNRMASEEEAKAAATPSPKKKDDQKQQHNKICKDDKSTIEPTLAHPKSKEWIVAAAKASYHELAKLASQYPELVKLQDPANGFTALHWAAKHGNEDVIKLIAGTYKANINARTNGGYTPLHIAMQFGRDNVFELLCNVYKANRDITDWSGNKPLDYRKQRTTISASTYSSEYLPWNYPPDMRNEEHLLAGEGLLSEGGMKLKPLNSRASLRSKHLFRAQSLMFPSNFNVFNNTGNSDFERTLPSRRKKSSTTNSLLNNIHKSVLINDSENTSTSQARNSCMDLTTDEFTPVVLRNDPRRGIPSNLPNPQNSKEQQFARGQNKRESFLRKAFRPASKKNSKEINN